MIVCTVCFVSFSPLTVTVAILRRIDFIKPRCKVGVVVAYFLWSIHTQSFIFSGCKNLSVIAYNFRNAPPIDGAKYGKLQNYKAVVNWLRYSFKTESNTNKDLQNFARVSDAPKLIAVFTVSNAAAMIESK